MQRNTFSRILGSGILWIRFDLCKATSITPGAQQTHSDPNIFVVIRNTYVSGVRKTASEFVCLAKLETR